MSCGRSTSVAGIGTFGRMPAPILPLWYVLCSQAPPWKGDDDVEDDDKGGEDTDGSRRLLAARLLMSGAGLLVMLLLGQMLA
jgi:hypothetical protein